MIISNSKTTSFLSDSFKEEFSTYLYHDFTSMLEIDKKYLLNYNLLNLFEKGYLPVSFNIFESLRFFWIQNYDNKSNILNHKKWVDIDFLLLDVAKPWYERILEIMDDCVDNFLNSAKVVQISVFIVVVAIFILCYFIIWKSYEEQLSLLLQRSFDLINLIPEEIKYLIVSKLNE